MNHHKWVAGVGRAQGSILITDPDVYAIEDHCAPGELLLFLTELWVPTHARGKGTAHALMLAATEWAEQARVDLWLYCAPFGRGKRMSEPELAGFYAKYGFKRVALDSPNIEMVRRYADRNTDRNSGL